MISARRYLPTLLAAACLVGLAPAGARGQGPTIGLKGGLNVSTLSVEDPANPDLEFDDETDFLAGAFIQCGRGWFALQGEVDYSRNGAKAQGTDPAVTLNLDYLRVPVLLMGRLPSGKSPVRPMLYAGPQVAIETRCRVTGEEGGESQSVACDSAELDDPLQTNNVEFGLVFGGGVEIPSGRFTMQLEARYNLGLTNINGGTDAAQVSVKNRGWTFALGLGMSGIF